MNQDVREKLAGLREQVLDAEAKWVDSIAVWDARKCRLLLMIQQEREARHRAQENRAGYLKAQEVLGCGYESLALTVEKCAIDDAHRDDHGDTGPDSHGFVSLVKTFENSRPITGKANRHQSYSTVIVRE